MHLLNIGVLQDIIASLLFEFLESGMLWRYVDLPGEQDWDRILHRWTHMAREWARGHDALK